MTPLHLAIFHGHVGIVKLLLSKVGTVDVNEFAEDENLHSADWMRVEEVSKELLREGMNIYFSSIKDSFGCGCLLWTSRHYENIVR